MKPIKFQPSKQDVGLYLHMFYTYRNTKLVTLEELEIHVAAEAAKH